MQMTLVTGWADAHGAFTSANGVSFYKTPEMSVNISRKATRADYHNWRRTLRRLGYDMRKQIGCVHSEVEVMS